LYDKHIALRLAEIRCGRAQKFSRFTKLPQFSITHLRKPLTQLFQVNGLLYG